mgnify:CR=1 FL=1
MQMTCHHPGAQRGRRLERNALAFGLRADQPAWHPFGEQGVVVDANLPEASPAVAMRDHQGTAAQQAPLRVICAEHVAEATTRLQDGQRVRVDGQSGQVVLLDAEARAA